MSTGKEPGGTDVASRPAGIGVVAATGESVAAPVSLPPGALRRVVTSTLLGGVTEWFDYFIYAQAAALVFPKVFFPNETPIVGVLLSFGGFAVGQFARPIGALIFGNLGDRYGRKPILVATFLLMGISSLLMGFLPSYALVGVWAPILLTILRIAQGFGAGAEFAGASILMIEYAPKHRRGLYGSVGTIGSSAGLMFGTLAFYLVQLLPEDAIVSWGWRIPFYLSAILVIVGFWIRVRVNESPLFNKVVEKRMVERVPLASVFRFEWKSLIVIFLLASGVQAGTYIFLTWVLVYMNGLKTGGGGEALYNPQTVTFLVFIAGIVATIFDPIWGALSDKIGRKVVFGGSALLAAALSIPWFLLMDTGNVFLAGISIALLGGFVLQMMTGVQGSLFAEAFSTKIRYSGFAIGREISAAIFGGLSPVIATAIVAASGGAFWGVAFYLMAVFVITFLAVLFLRETHKADLKL